PRGTNWSDFRGFLGYSSAHVREGLCQGFTGKVVANQAKPQMRGPFLWHHISGRPESGRWRFGTPVAIARAHLDDTQQATASSHGREEGRGGINGDCPMSEVTVLLDALAPGDAATAAQLLPLVYDDLRRLAARRLAHEAPGQTLDPTGLVHEA